MADKCFCHLNGFAVKDATARAEITELEKECKRASDALSVEILLIKARLNNLINSGGNTGGNTGGDTGGDTGGNTGGDTGGNTGGNTGGDNITNNSLVDIAQTFEKGDNSIIGCVDGYYISDTGLVEGSFSKGTPRSTGLIPVTFAPGESLIISGIDDIQAKSLLCSIALYDEFKTFVTRETYIATDYHRFFRISKVGNSYLFTPLSELYNGYFKYSYIAFTFVIPEVDTGLEMMKVDNGVVYKTKYDATAIHEWCKNNQRQYLDTTLITENEVNICRTDFYPTADGIVTNSFFEMPNNIEIGNIFRMRYRVTSTETTHVPAKIRFKMDDDTGYSTIDYLFKIVADGEWHEYQCNLCESDFFTKDSGNYIPRQFRLYVENCTVDFDYIGTYIV